MRIPCSLKEEPEEAFVMQYGHGLLGSHNEATSGWLARFSNKNKYIVVAVSDGDESRRPGSHHCDGRGGSFGLSHDSERSMQGMVEQMGALRMVMGAMAQDDHLIIDGVLLGQSRQTRTTWVLW